LSAEDELLAAQLKRTVEYLQGEIEKIKSEAASERSLFKLRIEELERCEKDHETRLRAIQESVTSFKTWSGLASGAAAILSLIALLRVALGY